MSAFQDLKIVKKCEDSEDLTEGDECKSFYFNDENFLEKADDSILFVDDSIVIQNQEEQKNEAKLSSESKLNTSNKPPDCFIDSPKPLNEQISLPLANVDELSFYEALMISTDNSGSIDEIGSSSILVEELDDGKILIFITQQLFENGERKNLEILSTITKDLKLIHERQIKRVCNSRKTTVNMTNLNSTEAINFLLFRKNRFTLSRLIKA
jgi:hypothetical protein